MALYHDDCERSLSSDTVTSMSGTSRKLSSLAGDLIQRKMSNGGIETYEVIAPSFHEGGSMIPAGYQIKHKNLGLHEAEKAVQSITYNLNGPNSRVNNHSTDNSTNVVNENSAVAEHIELPP